MARRDQLERTLHLLRLLGRAGGASLRELTDELRVTSRTIIRDLRALESSGVPVYDEPEGLAKRWRLTDGFLALGGLQLTLDELMALHAIRAEVQAADAGAFAAPLESVERKIRSVVPQVLLDRADDARRRVGAAPRPIARATSPGLATALLTAIEGGHSLRLDYRSRSADGRRLRVVDPYGLALRGAGMYLVARDVERDEIRKYLVARIEAADRVGRRFEPPADFNIEHVFGASFGVFGGKVERVVVSFNAQAAPFIRERQWHPSQELIDGPDGSVTLTMRVAGRLEVKSWVQSFGAAATLLEPRDLAKDVRSEAASVASRVLPAAVKRTRRGGSVARLAPKKRSTGRRQP